VRRLYAFGATRAHDHRHRNRGLDPDHAQQHDHGPDRGLRADGARQGLEAVADHVDLRRAERDPAEPRRLRDVARLRRRRRDPRRVRLQLPGRRLDVPPVGRESGLRADAGAVPADHRHRAPGDPRRGRGDGDPRPADARPRMTLPSLADSVEPAGATVGSGPPEEATRRGVGADLFRAVAHNRKALVGLGLLLFFGVLAVFPGQIAPDDPRAKIYPPGLGPSVRHLFGTTAYGEDVFSQLVFGTRQSVLIAFAVGGLATLIAVIVGVSAGYLGGKTDGVLSLIT